MVDTVKLIIEIPKAMYEDIKTGKDGYSNYVHTAIRNGIPLDDVKAEIAKIEIPEEVKTVDGSFAFCQALEIADIAIDRVVDKHIGKAESEDK